jgi:hypothetical protein
MQNQNRTYLDLSRDQSTWPFSYIMSETQPVNPRRPALGLDAPGVGADVVGVYNKIGVPPTTRTKRLKSQQEINTELYGTAPYLASGDGVMFNVEASNKLRDSIPLLKGYRSKYITADRPYDTWSFNTVPNAAQSIADQFGAQARAELAYE